MVIGRNILGGQSSMSSGFVSYSKWVAMTYLSSKFNTHKLRNNAIIELGMERVSNSIHTLKKYMWTNDCTIWMCSNIDDCTRTAGAYNEWLYSLDVNIEPFFLQPFVVTNLPCTVSLPIFEHVSTGIRTPFTACSIHYMVGTWTWTWTTSTTRQY